MEHSTPIRRRKNVLMVEDDTTAAQAMKMLLVMHGFPTRTASTLQDGSKWLDWAEVLILDLHLPDGNGIDLLARVRVQYPSMWVAVVTGCQDTPTLETLRADASVTLIQKPLNVEFFLNWMDRAGADSSQ